MTIEALLSLLAFFFLLGLFLETANEQLSMATNAADGLNAFSEAQRCSLIFDAIFANSGVVKETEINCFQESDSSVSAMVSGKKEKASLVASQVYLELQSGKKILEVKTNPHYK